MLTFSFIPGEMFYLLYTICYGFLLKYLGLILMIMFRHFWNGYGLIIVEVVHFLMHDAELFYLVTLSLYSCGKT